MRPRRLARSAARTAALAAGFGLLAAALVAGSALAHEDRLVADRYNVSVGYYIEPAQTGEENFLEILITDVTEGLSPVMGLEQTLQVELTAGGESTILALYPKTDRPGYRADVLPEVPGFYTARLFGSIEGASVDESFALEPVEGSLTSGVSTQTMVLGGVLAAGAAAVGGYIWQSSRREARRGGGGRGYSEPV